MKHTTLRFMIVFVIAATALIGPNEHAIAKKRFGFNLDYGLVNDVCRDGAEVGVDFWGVTSETYTYHAELPTGERLSSDLTLSSTNDVPRTFKTVIGRLVFSVILNPNTTIQIIARRDYTGQIVGNYPFVTQDCSLASSIAYQGRLTESDQPAQGIHDFTFRLFDSDVGGNQVGITVVRVGVPVEKGVFNVMLDFGHKVFDSNPKWVEISVRRGGNGQFTNLNPRQQILPAPFALYAANIPQHEHSGETWEGGKRLTIMGGGLDIHSRYGTSRIVIGNPYNIQGQIDAIGDAIDVQANGFNAPVNIRNSNGTAIEARNAYTNGSASTVGIYNDGNGSAISASSATAGLGSATLYAANSASGGYAGRFVGNVSVGGTLSKSAGSFKIDHPLNPANQYLNHSFVESPDMMNVYNGNIVLDANGEATVAMPAWFEALNREFRYQLTPIGGPGPNLYIAQEISGNQFRIAGGAPGLKVSWQVTGIRQDPYAEAHRIPVEEVKPVGEQGTYLHPELYGMPNEYGLDYTQTALRETAISAGTQEQMPDAATP